MNEYSNETLIFQFQPAKRRSLGHTNVIANASVLTRADQMGAGACHHIDESWVQVLCSAAVCSV